MSNYDYLQKKKKKWKKVFHFKVAAILLIFLPCDCAIPLKLKNHFSECEFQRNLTRSSRSVIDWCKTPSYWRHCAIPRKLKKKTLSRRRIWTKFGKCSSRSSIEIHILNITLGEFYRQISIILPQATLLYANYLENEAPILIFFPLRDA